MLGLMCTDGVVIAADTLGSYGSLARFRDISRLQTQTRIGYVGILLGCIFFIHSIQC